MRTRPERRPIRALDEQLVNRIAAGEVVERPASAVKELIENALDAGAARIEIETAMGGRRLIRVRDDGIGMTREDALNALQRHATSKIASDADLNRISTLGFRGEALPSIASVSRMEILTRAFEEETGTRIVVEGGEIKSVEEVGAPIGTTVTVRDLFYNVPARLKFLKTVPTELGHIVETVTRYAFAYPDVSLRLVHERQELIFTPGNGDLLTAVAAIWGRETVQSMVAVEYERDNIRVWGLVAPPHQTRPTRQHQYFFVNLRPVRNKTLTAALDEAYKSLTPEKRYPACVLLVGVDPRLVDVNVHPAKIEVRFAREQAVFEAVVNAVRAALLQHGMIPSALPPNAPRRAVITPPAMPDTETIHQILMQRAGLSGTDAPARAEELLGTGFVGGDADATGLGFVGGDADATGCGLDIPVQARFVGGDADATGLVFCRRGRRRYELGVLRSVRVSRTRKKHRRDGVVVLSAEMPTLRWGFPKSPPPSCCAAGEGEGVKAKKRTTPIFRTASDWLPSTAPL